MPGQKAAETERRQQILRAAFDVAAARGLEGLTIRRVAAQAGLSHGLVHFHFRTKADLLSALLEWLVLTTTALGTAPALPLDGAAVQGLGPWLGEEMRRLAGDRRRMRLLLDFWLLGTREPRIRARVRTELQRYRDRCRPMVEEVLRADPVRFAGVTADGVTAVLAALIKGAALQAVIEPRGLDVGEFTTAATALLAQLEPAAAWPD